MVITKNRAGSVNGPAAVVHVMLALGFTVLAGCPRAKRPNTGAGSSERIPCPRAFDHGRLVRAIRGLGKRPRLRKLKTIPLRLTGPGGVRLDRIVHPQGMAISASGRRIYLSAVVLAEGHRAAGSGYLFVLDLDGRLLRTVKLNRDPTNFHPGGMDLYRGRLYVPVAAYRPRSSARVLAIPLDTVKPEMLFKLDTDHLSFVVADRRRGDLLAASWDSATWYRFSPDGTVRQKFGNPTPGKLAHQDGQSLDGGFVLLTGYNPGWPKNTFGLDLVRLDRRSVTVVKSFRWRHRPRFPGAADRKPFDNPTFFWVGRAGRVNVLTAPNDQLPGLGRDGHPSGAGLELYALEPGQDGHV